MCTQAAVCIASFISRLYAVMRKHHQASCSSLPCNETVLNQQVGYCMHPFSVWVRMLSVLWDHENLVSLKCKSRTNSQDSIRVYQRWHTFSTLPALRELSHHRLQTKGFVFLTSLCVIVVQCKSRCVFYHLRHYTDAAGNFHQIRDHDASCWLTSSIKWIPYP